MKLLVLGGTVFLGRHLVDAALSRGHDVTLFHRGRSGAQLFPACEHLLGDRDGDLAPLRGRRFDAVVDTSGMLPRQVQASATLLADTVEHYQFISSVSAYADPCAGDDERAALATLGDAPDDQLTGESYGALKALCEQRLRDALPGRALVLRPGLIVGPHDPSDRYTWWPRRVAAGGELLAPAPRDAPVQYVDARDLAAFMLLCAERRTTGVLNTVGPAEHHTRADLLAACAEAATVDCSPTWVDEVFLLEQGVGPWMELPLWLPTGQDGLLGVDGSRARAAGLDCRAPTRTAADTLAWDRARTDRRGFARSVLSAEPVPVGLAPEREAALLAAWRERARD